MVIGAAVAFGGFFGLILGLFAFGMIDARSILKGAVIWGFVAVFLSIFLGFLTRWGTR